MNFWNHGTGDTAPLNESHKGEDGCSTGRNGIKKEMTNCDEIPMEKKLKFYIKMSIGGSSTAQVQSKMSSGRVTTLMKVSSLRRNQFDGPHQFFFFSWWAHKMDIRWKTWSASYIRIASCGSVTSRTVAFPIAYWSTGWMVNVWQDQASLISIVGVAWDAQGHLDWTRTHQTLWAKPGCKRNWLTVLVWPGVEGKR